MQTTNIENSPLKWRWTEKEYCQLSDSELSKIIPLAPRSAKEVWEKSLTFASKESNFSPNNILFTDITQIETKYENKVRQWLKDRMPNGEIIISWQPDLAVLTETELFIKNWDHFCYPNSDDVSIWPKDESYIIHYWHEEIFWYGRSTHVSQGCL